MKKKYIKPTAKTQATFYGDDFMVEPILKHSYDWVGAKERDDLEEDADIQERPNEYGIEPMTLW